MAFGMDDPTGGVSQADPEKIARSLVGDDLVNKYGDVMGVRPTGVADVVRDFATGVTEGPAKTEALKALARKQYQDAYFREKRAAVARAAEDRNKAIGMLQAVVTVNKLPPNQRATAYKDAMKSFGVTPDATAVKMFTDADSIMKLPLRDIFKAAERGDDGFTANDLANAFGSWDAATNFFQEQRQIESHRLDVQGKILDNELKKKRVDDATAAGSADSVNRKKYREKLGTLRVYDEAIAAYRLLTPAEIGDREATVFGDPKPAPPAPAPSLGFPKAFGVGAPAPAQAQSPDTLQDALGGFSPPAPPAAPSPTATAAGLGGVKVRRID
jgi:hypothetical protein